MEVNLPADLVHQLEAEIGAGRFPSVGALIEQALRRFLSEKQRSTERLEALRRIGQAVDDAHLYERIVLPNHQ